MGNEDRSDWTHIIGDLIEVADHGLGSLDVDSGADYLLDRIPRFSELESRVLFLLLSKGPLGSQELLRFLDGTISDAAFFAMMNKMLKKGYIRVNSEVHDGERGRPRRIFEIVELYGVVLQVQMVIARHLPSK